MTSAKIDPKEVHFVTIATEDVPALVANQIDTAILHVEQEMLARQKVPYQIAAGVSFYDRAEIKDLLAYLRLLYNPSDVVAFRRVGVPAG